MSYKDIVLADSPLFYWPMETIDSGANHYFTEIANPAALLSGIPRYAFLVGVGVSPLPTMVSPGLQTEGDISQWVPTMGGGVRNTTRGGGVNAPDDATSNYLAPATGSVEFWIRWLDPLGYQVTGTSWSGGTRTGPVDSWATIYGKDGLLTAAWTLVAYGGDIGIRYISKVGTGAGDPQILYASRTNLGASDSLADGLLHHIAFVFDHAAATCLVYRDGQALGGKQVPGLSAGTLYQDATDWWGAFSISGFQPHTQVATPVTPSHDYDFTGWNGQLGHVAVYTTKLTADQIETHWLVGGTTPVFPDSLNSVSGAEITLHPSAPLTVASTSGMHASVRLSLIRLSHIEGYFAPYGVRLAGATVWGELAQVGTSKAVMHKSGVVMSTRTSNYTTNSAGYLVMDIAPPQDVVPPHAHWELHWTGGTPVS